jgi:hypothetical protein
METLDRPQGLQAQSSVMLAATLTLLPIGPYDIFHKIYRVGPDIQRAAAGHDDAAMAIFCRLSHITLGTGDDEDR